MCMWMQRLMRASTLWDCFHLGWDLGLPFYRSSCAEAKALLWGIKFILNVGFKEVQLFGENVAALIQYLRCKAWVGRRYQQWLLKSFRFLWTSCLGFIVYRHWVRGSANAADPISRLQVQFGGELSLAREAATRRVGDLWAFPDRKTFFLWTRACQWARLCSARRGKRGFSRQLMGRAEFHDMFLKHCLEESLESCLEPPPPPRLDVLCPLVLARWGTPLCCAGPLRVGPLASSGPRSQSLPCAMLVPGVDVLGIFISCLLRDLSVRCHRRGYTIWPYLAPWLLPRVAPGAR